MAPHDLTGQPGLSVEVWNGQRALKGPTASVPCSWAPSLVAEGTLQKGAGEFKTLPLVLPQSLLSWPAYLVA